MQRLAAQQGPEGVVTSRPLQIFTLSAMLESMFDVDPATVDVQQYAADIEAITIEMQGQLRNPLRTLQFKLFPGCQVSQPPEQSITALSFPKCIRCIVLTN